MALRWVFVGLLLAGPSPQGARAQVPGDAGATPQGDARAGRELFVGGRAFARGGPACGACHAIGGEGRGAAATYGPDLTSTFETIGDPEMLDGLLAELPFPSMTPAYEAKALTPSERAHVAAFLATTGGRPPADEGGALALQAGALVALCAAFLWLASRRRGASARERLISNARSPQEELR